jgi:hypothetical protein
MGTVQIILLNYFKVVKTIFQSWADFLCVAFFGSNTKNQKTMPLIIVTMPLTLNKPRHPHILMSGTLMYYYELAKELEIE